MSVLGYEPFLRLALSDDPSLFPASFPAIEEIAAACPTGEPLAIEEWQTYFVRFYGDPAPAFLQDAKFVVRKIQSWLWELNFRNHVGLSRIGDLHLVVHNKKITNELYRDILDELAERYASLVFDFGSPVGQHYNKVRAGRDCAFVEYLFLCKYLLHDTPDLKAIGDILVYDPHRKFEREMQSCPIEECQEVGINIVHALVNSPMASLRCGHPLQQTNLGKILKYRTQQDLYPAHAAREIKYLTVDTHENRFIKFFLQSLLEKVEGLQKALVGETRSYFNPDIENNLGKLRMQIGQFLSHNMWREVGVMRFIPVSSQVLQRKEGYRQLFTLYSLLQLATHCDFIEADFRNLIEIKDLPTIYEYWCFFQVKAVVDSFAEVRKVSKIINESPLKHDLAPGLCIDYVCGAQLFFNKTYGGSVGLRQPDEIETYTPGGTSYSHTLRPDIVLVQNGRKLIFDAKYKGQKGGFYCEVDDGTIQKPKDDDIDKMHTYREAIKGVTGSFILYPGTQDILYPSHAGSTPFEGVGALALRPGGVIVKGSLDTPNLETAIAAFLDI